ncbi:MAG: M14 family metallopeptidase [Gammaproteobacteria bacterium]|nr:M14 family metallopeptidase [Gammaproteobacteria bacterium]
MLNIYDALPEGLLERDSHELHEVLPGPTLIHLRGRAEEPLFVSVMLHGNEDTGWLALRELLRRYRGHALPRSLSLFIGNVAAARERRRLLDGQPDFNRIWNDGDTLEHGMARQVLAQMRERRVFAAVDIHNNTGINPHYACVNALDPRYLQLATLFARTVVYFTRPETVCSMAFAALCPAVTLESGQPGQPHGTEHALNFVDSCLRLAAIPEHPVADHDLDLYHTVAVVKMAAGLDFGFREGVGDVWFVPDLDHLNFSDLPPGTPLGGVRDAAAELPLEVTDETGADVGARYFELVDGEILTRAPLMPSMFTLDENVIRQDCLGYVMERYHVPHAAA